jgi:hypothetical protein
MLLMFANASMLLVHRLDDEVTAAQQKDRESDPQ